MDKQDLENMEARTEQKKASIESLIAKAKKMEQGSTEEVYFESLGGTLTIKTIKEELILSALGRMGDGDDLSLVMDIAKEVIYNACDIFRSKELQSSFDCVEPYDIVPMVLNISERSTLFAKILVLNGFDETDLSTIIKNA